MSVVATNGPSCWTCPNRERNLPGYDTTYNQYILGVCYFGGITNWYPSPGGNPNTTSLVPEHSPVRLTTSKPYWAFAADSNIKVAGGSGGVGSRASQALPPTDRAIGFMPMFPLTVPGVPASMFRAETNVLSMDRQGGAISGPCPTLPRGPAL